MTFVTKKQLDWIKAQEKLPGVFIPVKTTNPLNTRRHWRVVWSASKKARTATMLACKAARVSLKGNAIVAMTRYSNGELDDDNLGAAMKPVRDGVADVLGINDRDLRVKWVCRQEKSPPKCYGVRVLVELAGKSAA